MMLTPKAGLLLNSWLFILFSSIGFLSGGTLLLPWSATSTAVSIVLCPKANRCRLEARSDAALGPQMAVRIENAVRDKRGQLALEELAVHVAGECFGFLWLIRGHGGPLPVAAPAAFPVHV